MRVLRCASYIAQPWKNGGGTTREIIRVPDTTTFDWRLSIADIATSSEFSNFSGYHRVMVLLRGCGVTLRARGFDQRRLTETGDLTAFDGALAMHGELIDGACVDLNLMLAYRLAGAAVEVRSITGHSSVTAKFAHTLVLFCIAGQVALAGEDGFAVTLDAWDCAISEAADLSRAAEVNISARQTASVFIAQIPE